MVKNINDTGAQQEWGDSRRVEAVFGLGRGLLYELVRAGLIQSVSLRRPGQVKGKRLFCMKSIRAYLTGIVSKGGK